jgi:hypothetical protein
METANANTTKITLSQLEPDSLGEGGKSNRSRHILVPKVTLIIVYPGPTWSVAGEGAKQCCKRAS